APLALNAYKGQSTGQVAVAYFTDPAAPAGEGLTQYAATINWGDGTGPTTGTIVNNRGLFTVYGSHTYAAASGSSPYQITVTVDHGTSTPAAQVTATATVSN